MRQNLNNSDLTILGYEDFGSYFNIQNFPGISLKMFLDCFTVFYNFTTIMEKILMRLFVS